MQVTVDGLLTTYRKSGEGSMVLLLHGWGDDSRGFQGLQTALSKHFTVVTPDLPGFGGTQAPTDAWGLDDYARFVALFCQKLSLPPPFGIIGHSNGGAIAIRGLRNDSFTAQRLVLLASAGIRGTYKGRTKLLRVITKTGKAVTMPLPSRTKRRLRQKVYHTVGSDMLVAEHLQETFKKIVNDDIRTDAKELRLPTLLLYGDHDEQTPQAFGVLLHEAIQGSELTIIPGGDHFMHLNLTNNVVQYIEGFLVT